MINGPIRPERPKSPTEDHADLAQALAHAQQGGGALEHAGWRLGLDQGYAVQRHGRSLRTANGDHVVGRKVGLTSAAARERFSTDDPVSGYLLGSTVAQQPDSCSLMALSNPRVEVEIAFLMRTSLSGHLVSDDDVMAATSEVALALEIVDSRWTGGAPSAGLLVADNVSAAAVVLGARTSASVAELQAVEVTVEMGDHVIRGEARNVHGHPVRSVAWLVSQLAGWGEGLEDGDIVLSGSLTTPLPVAPGDHLVADYGHLGRISTTFTA